MSPGANPAAPPTTPPTVALPERLPGEPAEGPPPGPVLALMLTLRAAVIALLAALLLPLWVPFAVGLLVYGYPPVVPAPRRVLRYLGWCLTRRPGDPPLPALTRAWLALSVLRSGVTIPLWGLAWMIDELAYGRALDAVRVEGPLFHLSAGRSGSTRMAHYLERDPHLVAPSLLQSVFPYLWLWRLAPRTFGRLISAERVRAAFARRTSDEFRARHEGDPFATDTFDAALFALHLNGLSVFLGPQVMAAEFAMGAHHPGTEALWTRTTPALIDRLARKTLLHAGPAPDGRPRQFFLKGHFLAAAEALAARFPDGRFLTIARPPAARLRSLINFMRVSPIEPAVGWPPWATLAPALLRTEVEYCARERAWFGQAEGPIRCVVRFADFIDDLGGTLDRVYRLCLDAEATPPALPRTHPPRDRQRYRVDRRLDQLGIDADALAAQTADYVAWAGLDR